MATCPACGVSLGAHAVVCDCLSIQYCSTDCQERHRVKHREECEEKALEGLEAEKKDTD